MARLSSLSAQAASAIGSSSKTAPRFIEIAKFNSLFDCPRES
jgi:hypothetical protein